MSGAVSDHAQHEAGHVELPYSGAQQCQRSNAAAKHRHAGKNDAARTKAVDPPAQQRGAQTHSDGADCEAAGDGFAAPAEFRAQRLYKNRESINEQRAEPAITPKHAASTTRQP